MVEIAKSFLQELFNLRVSDAIAFSYIFFSKTRSLKSEGLENNQSKSSDFSFSASKNYSPHRNFQSRKKIISSDPIKLLKTVKSGIFVED